MIRLNTSATEANSCSGLNLEGLDSWAACWDIRPGKTLLMMQSVLAMRLIPIVNFGPSTAGTWQAGSEDVSLLPGIDLHRRTGKGSPTDINSTMKARLKILATVVSEKNEG